MKKRKVDAPEPRREINVENEAKCMIARHGTETLQGASFGYVVDLTKPDLDLSIREDIARLVRKMVSTKGTWEHFLNTRMRSGMLMWKE